MYEELFRLAVASLGLPHRERAIELGRMIDESTTVDVVLDRLFPDRSRAVQNRALCRLLAMINEKGRVARSGFRVRLVGPKSGGAKSRTFEITRTRWSSAEMGIGPDIGVSISAMVLEGPRSRE